MNKKYAWIAVTLGIIGSVVPILGYFSPGSQLDQEISTNQDDAPWLEEAVGSAARLETRELARRWETLEAARRETNRAMWHETREAARWEAEAAKQREAEAAKQREAAAKQRKAGAAKQRKAGAAAWREAVEAAARREAVEAARREVVELLQQQLRQFPWPPPHASAIEIIPRKLLEAKQEATLLRDVDSKITQALKQTGYYESSYYAVPKGFAIATRIEQIEQDGSPKKEPQRWSLESQPASFTLAAYLKALFLATPGYYRVIVFVVTPYPLTQSPAETIPEEAKKWLSGGQNRLPESIGNMEFLQIYTCTALIYEFERQTESEEPRFRQPSRLPSHTHLVKAGIWQSLEQ